MSQAIMAQKQKTLAEAAQANPDHRFTNLYSLMHWDYWIRTAMDTTLSPCRNRWCGVIVDSMDSEKGYEVEGGRVAFGVLFSVRRWVLMIANGG